MKAPPKGKNAGGDGAAAFQDNQDRDKKNRFEFLLQQTELFAHFMSTGVKAGMKSPTSPLKMGKSGESNGIPNRSGPHKRNK